MFVISAFLNSQRNNALVFLKIVDNGHDAVIPEHGVNMHHACRCDVSRKEGLRTAALLLEGVTVFNEKALIAILDVGLVLLNHDSLIS